MEENAYTKESNASVDQDASAEANVHAVITVDVQHHVHVDLIASAHWTAHADTEVSARTRVNNANAVQHASVVSNSI